MNLDISVIYTEARFMINSYAYVTQQKVYKLSLSLVHVSSPELGFGSFGDMRTLPPAGVRWTPSGVECGAR